MSDVTNPHAFDPVQASAFLQALGRDPDRTWFRSIGDGRANRRRYGKDLPGFNPTELTADCAAGSAVYFITGNASTATGKNPKGESTGSVCDADIASCPALFVEWDDQAIDWQLTAWQQLGLPEPTLMVTTGGKSVHAYWVLDQPLPPEQWKPIQSRLVDHCKGDTQCKNPSRLMRLPGSVYFDKKTGQPTGQARIHTNPGHRYSLETITACLPPEPAPKAPAIASKAPGLASDTSHGDLPPRGLAAINAAAGLIPKRVGGRGNYEADRNALCGCSAALAEAGHSDPDAAALTLLGHLWPSEGAAFQVLQSTTTRDAASFWAVARKHGYDLTRHDLKGQHPKGNGASDPGEGEPPEEAPDEAIERLVNELLDLRLMAKDTWSKEMAAISSLTRGYGVARQDAERRTIEALASRLKLSIAQSHTGTRTNRSSIASEDAEGQQMLVHGFLPWKRDTLIFGPSGAGKTTAAAALAWCAISGTPFLDHQIPGDITGKVLWIGSDGGDGAYDMWLNTAQDLGIADDPRWIDGCIFWGSEPDNDVGSWSCTPAGLLELKTELEKGGYALVVIDSWKAVLELANIDFGIGPVGTVVRFLQALIGQHCSALYLHHPSGNSKGKGVAGAGGNQNINQIPYAVHQLSTEPVSEGQPPCVRWSAHKLRGYQSREFIYRLSDDGLQVTQGDVITNCADSILITVADLEGLGTATTSHRIKTMLNTTPESTISNNLTRLRQRGFLRKVGGCWHLTMRGKLAHNRLFKS